MQVVGDIGNITVGMGLAQGRGVEPAFCAEAVLIGLIDHKLIVSHRQAVGDHHVLYTAGDGVQITHKLAAFACAQAGDDIVAAFHCLQRFMDRYILCHIAISLYCKI